MIKEPNQREKLQNKPAIVHVDTLDDARYKQPENDPEMFYSAASLALQEAEQAGYSQVSYQGVASWVVRDPETDRAMFKHSWWFHATKGAVSE